MHFYSRTIVNRLQSRHVHNERTVLDLELEPQKTCLELVVGRNQLLPCCSQGTGILAGGKKKTIETPLQKVEAIQFME